MHNVKCVTRSRVYSCGYEVRTEIVDDKPYGGDGNLKMVSAYNMWGQYIGSPEWAHKLVAARGIQPSLRTPESCVCSVGYSVKDGKWYGWSHRAIYGFKPGSKCKKGDGHYIPKSAGGRGAWTAKTVADARKMAYDFAASVS